MGMTIPGELSSLLSMLGYEWPRGDETGIMRLGGSWMGFDGRLNQPLDDADADARRVISGNRGKGIDAFRDAWSRPESARDNLRDGATAATLIGAGLLVCAGIVTALKINMIIQLTVLAVQIFQAVAAAPVTFGASLLQIPLMKAITGMIIDQLIGLAVNAVLGG